jgi:hypothetical protein
MTSFKEIRQFDFDDLPVGASILIIGKRHSGKSYLQYAIMEAMAAKFTLAFGLSPTIAAKERFRKCMPAWCVFDLSIEILESICHNMKMLYDRQVMLKRKPVQWLLVLDDTAFDDKFMKSTALKEVFANGRNFGCTIIVILQYIKAAPPIMRTNSDFVFCFAEQGEKGRQQLHEQYFSAIPKKEFNGIFAACTENYSTIVANNRNPGRTWKEQIYWKRASTSIPDFFIGSAAAQHIDRRCYIKNPELEQELQAQNNVLLLELPEPVRRKSDSPQHRKADAKSSSESELNLDDFDFDDA